MISSLFKSAGVLAIGTIVGQGIVLLATPWLARNYGAEAFGELAMLITVSNIALAMACLRYDLALPAAEGRFSQGLIRVCMISALACAGLAVAIFSLAWFFRLALGETILASSPALVAICVFMAGSYQAAGSSQLRQGKYWNLAAMRISQGVGFILAAVVPGIGLLWAHIFSFCSGVLIIRGTRVLAPAEATTWEAACRFRHFPLISAPGALLDVVGHSCATWVIISNYGSEAAGHYSQIQRLIGAPMMLASLSLGQALLKKSADMTKNRKSLASNLVKLLLILVAIASAALVLVWFVGEPVLRRLLGKNWRVDRDFITFIAAAVFVRACIAPLSSVLVTFRRFDIALIWQILYFASAVVLLPWLGRNCDFDEFIRFYAFNEFALYLTYALLIFKTIRD